MSILNAFVTPELALLGVDTEVRFPDGTMGEACKLITLPHLSVAIGFRGLDALFMAAIPVIVGFKGSFDALVEIIPGLIDESVKFCRDQWSTPDEMLLVNFVIVGYSESAGRMTGHLFERDLSGQIKSGHDFPQSYAPFWNAEDLKSLGIKADRDGMGVLAQNQCKWMRERGPVDNVAGGRFFIAEVRRNSVKIEQAFKFPGR